MWSLIIGLGLAVAAPEMIPEEDLELIGRAAPTFDLHTLDGGNFKLEDYRGKLVVLSFWASWCSPCRYELPALNQLSKQRSDVVFIGVNVDREPGPAKKFLKGISVDFPIIMDNNSEVLGEYNVMSMPTLFLIDKQGIVAYSKTGFSREKGLAELEAAISKADK